jgi:CRISPR-associated protein Cas2
MSEEVSRYVIAYDIEDDKRRTRLAKHLQEYGVRVQFSVFIVDLRPARMLLLKSEIEQRIDSSQDSVMVCRVGVATAIEPKAFMWIGRNRPEPPAQMVII